MVRQRIRSLRTARGWSLDALARHCGLSPSTLSRIETGTRRIALDQLVPIAQALGISLDELVDPRAEEDVVIRPEPQSHPGLTTWLLSRDRAVGGVTVVKMRIEPGHRHATRIHPGHEWFTVLSGVARLTLGDRVIYVRPGQAAEFSTMTPHAINADAEAVEVLSIFDGEGRRVHLRDPVRP